MLSSMSKVTWSIRAGSDPQSQEVPATGSLCLPIPRLPLLDTFTDSQPEDISGHSPF